MVDNFPLGAGYTTDKYDCAKPCEAWKIDADFVRHAFSFSIRTAQDPQYTAFVDNIGEDYSQREVSRRLQY
jgi:hypothetical protein